MRYNYTIPLIKLWQLKLFDKIALGGEIKQRIKQIMKRIGERTGDCLIREGLIKKEDIDAVLFLQKNRESIGGGSHTKFFGSILCELNLLDPTCNYYFLHKYDKLFSIADFLCSNDILSSEKIKTAQKKSKDTGIPLLSTLLSLEMVTKSTLQKLVQELYNLPFIFLSPQAFEEAETQDLPFQFSREEAIEKKMLPLMIKNKTVTIGITDPENLLSVYELAKKIPKLKFEPVFILYSCFHRFFHLLYEQDSKGSEPEPDLSLLYKSKITITDPGAEQLSIAALYSRYELLNGLNGYSKTKERIDTFKKFILQEHQKITRNHGCSSVDYLFRKQKNQVNLIAVPKI